jgi:hypothetical protein
VVVAAEGGGSVGSATMRCEVMSVLGPEPEELAPLPRAFFRALVVLLDALGPPWLDEVMTKASRRDDGVEIVLASSRDVAWTVWVQAEREQVLVGCSAMHEERSDPAEALTIVAQLLCGEREVRGYDGATFRPDFGARKS